MRYGLYCHGECYYEPRCLTHAVMQILEVAIFGIKYQARQLIR